MYECERCRIAIAKYAKKRENKIDISGQWKTIRIECFSFNRMQSFHMNTCFAYYDLYLVSSNNGKCTAAAVLHFWEKRNRSMHSVPILISAISHPKKKQQQRQDDMSAVKAFCHCFISPSLLLSFSFAHLTYGLENFSFCEK